MTLEFYYDIVSPNAYLGEMVLRRLEAKHGVTFERMPILLGGLMKSVGSQPPFMALKETPMRLKHYLYDIGRFADRRDIAYATNPHFPLLTVGVQRMAIAAKELDCEADFIAAFYQAMWAQGLKIDEPQVLADVMNQAGLPAEALIAKSKEPTVKKSLLERTQAAQEKGVFGAPTTFVGKEMFFGKDTLDQVELELKVQGVI